MTRSCTTALRTTSKRFCKGDVAVPPGAVAFVRDVAQYFVQAKAHQ